MFWSKSQDKFTHPKRRFWKAEPTFPNVFSKHFSGAWVLDLGYESLKIVSKHIRKGWFGLPKSSFGEHKVKLLSLCSPNEDFVRRNKRWNADFRSTFPRFVAQIEYSRHWTLEKCFENPHFIFCSSLQNLRLGWVKFLDNSMPMCLSNSHGPDVIIR